MSNKVFVEFSISGILEVEESRKDAVMKEISKVINKLLTHKDVVKTEVSVDSTNDDNILENIILSNYNGAEA
jgi:hypothetical protein